jgi:hypothetical protein
MFHVKQKPGMRGDWRHKLHLGPFITTEIAEYAEEWRKKPTGTPFLCDLRGEYSSFFPVWIPWSLM